MPLDWERFLILAIYSDCGPDHRLNCVCTAVTHQAELSVCAAVTHPAECSVCVAVTHQSELSVCAAVTYQSVPEAQPGCTHSGAHTSRP